MYKAPPGVVLAPDLADDDARPAHEVGPRQPQLPGGRPEPRPDPNQVPWPLETLRPVSVWLPLGALRWIARFLEARHRAHARVEDRIRTGKDTGLGHLPSRHQNINEVWVELALIAADLLALAQSMLLTCEPELHRAEPKTLRYRLLHVAARITRGQRKVFLRLAEHWPWALARGCPEFRGTSVAAR